MDIFIPFHVKDVDALPSSVASLRKFVEPSPKRIICVSAPLPGALQALLERLSLEWIDESSVIPGLPRSAMPTIIIRDKSIYDNLDRTGWYFQQFLKWGFRRLTREPCYAVADADTVFIAATALLEGQTYILHRSGQYHMPYFRTFQKVLGFAAEPPEPQLPSFIADHMVFDVAILEELIGAIERQHPGKTWHQAILDSIVPTEVSSFSEFETYGNFVKKFHADRYISKPYLNVTLPKDHLEKHEQNSKEAARLGYSSISYHSHNVEEIDLVFREIQHCLDLQKAGVILDVGSGNGDAAAIARRYSPSARIFAFECDPLGVKLCRLNFGARTDIQLIERAISDVAGPTELFANSKTGQQVFRTEATTLHDWCRLSQLEGIDVLWINLRTSVVRALRGLGAMIHCTRVIVVPIHSSTQDSAASPKAFLEANGFRLHPPRVGINRLKHEVYVQGDRSQALSGSSALPHRVPPSSLSEAPVGWGE